MTDNTNNNDQKLNQLLVKYSKEAVKEARKRDFETWFMYLTKRIKKMVDKVSINTGDPLTEKNKVCLDCLFCEIESLIEQAEKNIL